jgi:hypothetical protein
MMNHWQDSFLTLTSTIVGKHMNEAPLSSWNAPLRIVYLNLPVSV